MSQMAAKLDLWKLSADFRISIFIRGTKGSGTCMSNTKKLPLPGNFFVSLYARAQKYVSTPFIDSSCQAFLFFLPCGPQRKDNQENCCYYYKDCCTHNAYFFKESRGRFYWSLLKFLYYTSFLTPCALPSVQLFSNAKAKIRTYSRTSKFST